MKPFLHMLLKLTSTFALSGCYGNCGLTDDDVIRKAVEFYIEEKQPGIDGYFESDGIVYRRYESFEEFIAVNPDCCRMERLLPEWGRVPLRHRLWYNYRGTVYINSFHQRMENGSIILEDGGDLYPHPYDLIVPISSCGKPLMSLVEY